MKSSILLLIANLYGTLRRRCYCLVMVLLLFACFLPGFTAHAQTTHPLYKSFTDSVYVEGDRLIAPKIHFANGGVRIMPQCYDSIQVVARFLQQYPAICIEIGGHTDNRGHETFNLDLSQMRAEAVKYLLVDRFGINPARLTAKGYGEAAPRVPKSQIDSTNDPQVREALYNQNQRIEIRIWKN